MSLSLAGMSVPRVMRLARDNKVIFSELKYVPRYRGQDPQTSFFW